MLVADKITTRIKELILKAPAGGAFHDATCGPVDGDAGKSHFAVKVPGVGTFTLTVEQH